LQKITKRAVEGASKVVAEGVVLNWMEAGTGKPLVLIHGGHGGLVHWQANVAELARDHRVLAPDLAGFGQSSDPRRCLAPAEHAHVLAAWLGELDIANAAVVGFSFGALVAVEWALAEPQRMAGLVLVNPPGVGPRSADALELPARLSTFAKEHGRRAGIERTLCELMLCRHELVTAALVDQMTLAAERTRHVTRAISRSSDTLPRLRQLQMPACALIGERDPFHRNDLDGRRRSIDEAIGMGATRLVPRAAHWLQYDQPQAFASELRRFFQQRPETP
jgi:2-hydroxy-6-oxonona-2,4-dienedioate hydrolase